MLTVAHLACTRGERRLFHDVSFSLAPGEWLHLEGENGAGKTSLLRILCGLLSPESGEICWNGARVDEGDDAYRRELLYFGHAGAIKDDLTALENLCIAAALGGRHLAEEEAVTALRRIGLRGREDLPTRVLSQGQKRRVALARLITSPARLWVLDEPFVALDVRAIELLCTIIGDHLQRGGMALFTSHQAVDLGPGGRRLRLGEAGA